MLVAAVVVDLAVVVGGRGFVVFATVANAIVVYCWC